MKKFSTSIGQKVNEEPKAEVKKVNEEEIFKSKVLNLMDQFLSIQTYGPVDRYLRAGNIKISGKEVFLEALMSLMNDKSNSNSKAILESLKSEIGDWKTIDSKIQELDSKIEENFIDNIKNKEKVISIYKKWGADKNLCLQMFEKHIDKITDSESAYSKHLISESLSNDGNYPQELFKKVSEKFLEKSKQLGSEK